MRIQPGERHGSDIPVPVAHHHHHQHGFTRRAFVGAGATAAGVALLRPATALGDPHTDDSPNPTTNKIEINGLRFSLTFFGPGLDPSSITDFNGFVGVADVQGTGTAHNPDGSTETLLYDTDMRFMTGTYIGKDGKNYKGTFGFV